MVISTPEQMVRHFLEYLGENLYKILFARGISIKSAKNSAHENGFFMKKEVYPPARTK